MSEVVLLLDLTTPEVLGVFPDFTEECDTSSALAKETRPLNIIVTQRWVVSDEVSVHRYHDARRTSSGTIHIVERLWAHQREDLPFPSRSHSTAAIAWGAADSADEAVRQLLVAEGGDE